MNWTTWIWEVQAAQERADVAILKAMEAGTGNWSGNSISYSRSQLKRLIEEGHVLIAEGNPGSSSAGFTPIRANQKIRPGAQVKISFPPPKEVDVIPEDRPIDILFEDEHLVIVNKPPALTVHPSTTQMNGTLVNALLHHIDDLSGIGGKLRPGIVHRIDKDTSGALVISKTDVCHRRLTEIFSEHAIDRVYWALVYGAPAGPISSSTRQTKTRIETQIGRNPKDRKKMAILPSGGRHAVTYFQKIEEYAVKTQPFASFLEVTLETGRTHQVRVHLTSIGHSLLGDPVYGTPTERQYKWTLLPKKVQESVRQLPGQALHARVLGFEHPITGKKIRVEAEVPQAFGDLLGELRIHSK